MSFANVRHPRPSLPPPTRRRRDSGAARLHQEVRYSPDCTEPTTLAELGISKKTSACAQTSPYTPVMNNDSPSFAYECQHAAEGWSAVLGYIDHGEAISNSALKFPLLKDAAGKLSRE